MTSWISTILFLLCFVGSAWSIPAASQSYTIKQQDGTSVEVQKKGNEWFHYIETTDGHPLVQDNQGHYHYADAKGKPSGFHPHKKEHRSSSEKTFLEGLSKRQVLEQMKNLYGTLAESAPKFEPIPSPSIDSAISGMQLLPAINPNYKSGEKNALVILVQFSDTKFSIENPQVAFDSLLNQERYNKGGNLGSVRDYFIDNSMGSFSPHFDVVGPITLKGANFKDYGAYSSHGFQGAIYALTEALDSMRVEGFDFSKYDNDGDRVADFVHMIYAGYGAHDTEQDSAIWPHSWTYAQPYRVSNSTRKPYYVFRYSCNSELDGHISNQDSTKKGLFGVGAFIHEFSHLLGLIDLYSTDNSSTYTLASWDVMDMGEYNSLSQDGAYGTAPPNYSAFERLSLGWLTPTDLNVKGNVKLSGIQNNVALQIPNPENEDEFFLLEYRTASGWDAAIPNHGLLIWHVDYEKKLWDSSAINNDPLHQHVDLEEADGTANIYSLKGDPFPGTSRVKNFNKFITWDSTNLNIALSNITESKSYTYVSFNVNMDADSGNISLMEDITEDIEELSSSSTAIQESSSSEVPINISSSSSSTPEKTSSSSEASTATSSSSSLWITETGLEISTNTNSSRLHVHGNQIQIYTNNDSVKNLRIFSINGQLLETISFRGSSFSYNLHKFGQPLLLSLWQGNQVVSRTLFIFRE